MSILEPCPGCGCFVRRARSCPSCDGAGVVSTAARVLGLAVMGAGLAACQSMYGIAVVKTDTGDSGDTALRDRDGDGFASDEDCNDEDPDVFPGATDTPGDGLGTNCDGADDT